ncbi:uncharacterized protein DS421_17g584460 [Arachis hypogaea]|nr:uncharacterized protein DS421_17g584460 [Arachis hypogaea]
MAILVWCILMEKPLNIPRLIRQAMGQVQTVDNLPFPALVTNLVSMAGVSYEATDVKTMIPRDDKIVPNGKYIRPPMVPTSLDMASHSDILATSTAPLAPQQSAYQLLIELTEKVDRQGRGIEQIERRNKRRYNYLKKLIGSINPPTEEPDTPECTSDHSMESNQEMDSGSDDSNPALLITDGTEDRAKL